MPFFGTVPLHQSFPSAERWSESAQEPEHFDKAPLGSGEECRFPGALYARRHSPTTRTAIYVRCSTAGIKKYGSVPAPLQNPEVQLEPLKALVQQCGWSLFRVYADRMSGAKQARPGLQALMSDASRGKFHVVLVWRFDRLARSVKQLVLALEEFRSLSVDFVSHQEALDTGTPMGKAMFTIIAAIAELERSIIRERVMAGLEHAKKSGTKSCRPIGRPRRIERDGQTSDRRPQGRREQHRTRQDCETQDCDTAAETSEIGQRRGAILGPCITKRNFVLRPLGTPK